MLNRPFLRHAAVLASGTAVGQIIALAVLPVITRLYDPSQFGSLALFTSLLSILGVIGNLRYELAIPLPDSDGEAYSLLILTRVIAFGFSIVLAIVIFWAGEGIAIGIGAPQMNSYLWLLPVGVFLVSVVQSQVQWALRRDSYISIGRARVAQSFIVVTVQLAGYSLGALALIVAKVLGHSASALFLYNAMPAVQERLGKKAGTISELKFVSYKYRNFPLISSWTGLCNAAATNLVPILLVSSLGVGPAGLFGLAYLILSQPMALIGKAVGDVFYRNAPDAHRNGELGAAVQELFERLTFCATPIALFIFLIAPVAFSLLFGQNWEQAGVVAGLMVPWLLMQFVVTPSTRVFPVLDKHEVALRFQVSLLVSAVVGIATGAKLFGTLSGTIAVVSMLNAVTYLTRIIFTYAVLGLDRWRPLKVIFNSCAISVVPNLPLLLWWSFRAREGSGDAALIPVACLSLILIALQLALVARKSREK